MAPQGTIVRGVTEWQALDVYIEGTHTVQPSEGPKACTLNQMVLLLMPIALLCLVLHCTAQIHVNNYLIRMAQRNHHPQDSSLSIHKCINTPCQQSGQAGARTSRNTHQWRTHASEFTVMWRCDASSQTLWTVHCILLHPLYPAPPAALPSPSRRGSRNLAPMTSHLQCSGSHVTP